MNLFKTGRGDFWGIIVPGGFLFLNVFTVYFLGLSETSTIKIEMAYSFVIIGTLISYILGYILRLIKPEYLEKISVPFLLVLYSILKSLSYIFNYNARNISDALEPFPYINIWYGTVLDKMPKSVKTFYNNLKNSEFDNILENMSGQVFFNYCKRYVIEKSNYLREDIYFAEGLSRFLNGMFYAIVISIIFIISNSSNLSIIQEYINLILVIYSIVLLFILLRFKGVRFHESMICLTSFYVTKSNCDENIVSSE